MRQRADRSILYAVGLHGRLGSHLRQRITRSVAPGIAPEGFVEGAVGLIEPPLPGERKAEVVERLAVARIRVAPREPRNAGAEELLRLSKVSLPQRRQPHGVIHARVAGVSPQAFVPVERRRTRAVSVLLDVR